MSTAAGSSPPGEVDEREDAPANLIDALLVYAEPLATEAHVVVLGDSESSVAHRLLELGARGVHVFDPDPARAASAARIAPRGVTVRALVDDLDVRDGAFDLAVVADLAELNDPRDAVARLRRAVSAKGSIVAMGRAHVAGEEGEKALFGPELGPAALDYAGLYDIFAMQFDHVSIAGVVPFNGIVFAELGIEEDEPPPVSVDTRLAPNLPPSVFVIVAAQHQETVERPDLDPFAIVQIPSSIEAPRESTRVLEAVVAATQLKADLLGEQLQDVQSRFAAAVGTDDVTQRLGRAASERDSALTRAMELEAVLAASQQTMASLERRLLEAERGMLERDDRIAALSAELDDRRSSETPFLGVPVPVDVAALLARVERAEAALAASEHAMQSAPTINLNADIHQLQSRAERAEAALAVALAELAIRQENVETTIALNVDVGQLRARAERAEAALAIHGEDLAHVAEAHGQETAGYEEQLRDRARVIAGLENELRRREALVKELVTTLDEARQGMNGVVFEAASPLSTPPARLPPTPAPPATAAADAGEVERLARKLDELAAEVARREGELVARGWRIRELEDEVARLQTLAEAHPDASMPPRRAPSEDAELARIQNELDALRQALAQEHALRLAAESGEELAHARSELARQAALLEQMRGRVRGDEAPKGPGAPFSGPVE
jgi:hypothetical protein